MKSKRQTTVIFFVAAGLLAIILILAGRLSGYPRTPEPGIGSTQVSPKDGMVMVYVPAGEFLMGAEYTGEPQESKTERGRFVVFNESPQHMVYLDAYWIDQTEVTQEMYAKCVAEGQCKEPSCSHGGDDYPVICVSYIDSVDYCAWAGRQLPTEAQWEKAARGTDGRIYPWGDEPATCEYAVINDGTGSGFCGEGNTVWPVGSKPKGASPYGALDMAGNAWERVADWYATDYYEYSSLDNPTGPEVGQFRVVRGGGEFDYYWYDVRTTARVTSRMSWRDLNLGFRCATPAEP
ncbi:MAG: SUMF1/EgtB/PvdO family nonheme iron enzyme [Anaerolineae bacterium]|nr:SUMF1/EgtB/PvdO family nonheme iron enzyme [Anaerolineae bacterium]